MIAVSIEIEGPHLTLGGVWVWLERTESATTSRVPHPSTGGHHWVRGSVKRWRGRSLDTIDGRIWRSKPYELQEDALADLCKRHPQAGDVFREAAQ